MAGQLAGEGRFKFRCQWFVGNMHTGSKVIARTHHTWTAGSVEEMLAAIQAAKIAVEGMPGIGQLVRQTKKCGRCGAFIGQRSHTTEQCRVGPDGTLKETR